jgi:hypothetical protein
MSFWNDTLEAKAREHVWRATSPRARPTQESTSRRTTRCVRTSFPAHSLDSRARTLSSSSPKPRAVEINKNRWIAGRRRRGCPASLRASFHPRSKYSFRLSSDEKLDTVLTSSPPLPNRETRVQARRQNDKNTKESVITSSDKTRVSKNLL